ncbi:MAG TPA: CPBP family intramembrane metalloprotease, partial [Deltaproteobacteria bacterium]|nr:CPBP family intramembrane metalloprotease [Deltaproteobacteria bacterium]
IGVIIAVVCCEVVFRLAYHSLPLSVDPLLYTLGVRFAETAVILSLAFPVCGIKAGSIRTELLIGIGISAAFGAAVVSADLLSMLMIEGGILKILIARQQVPDPLLFFVTGCVFAPFVEELFFRGLFYSWLRERLPVAISVFFSALAFASIHGFLSPVQITGGLLFAVIFEWRKNIWAPYTVHAIANTGIWILPWIYPFW